MKDSPVFSLDPAKFVVKPAPKRSANGGAQAALRAKLVLPLLALMFDRELPISRDEVESCVNQPVSGWLFGNVTGAGIADGGLNLWKHDKCVLPCRENALLLWEAAKPSQKQQFLVDRGWDLQQFETELLALPEVE